MEGGIFILAPDDSLPEGGKETAAVAKQLDERGDDGERPDPQAAVRQRGVDPDQQGVNPERERGPGANQRADEQHEAPEREERRQEVHHLQRVGVFLVEVDPGDPEIIDLAVELAPVGAPLVINPGGREEADLIAALEEADTEVDVLAEPHPREAVQGTEHLGPDAHVETAGIELVHFLLAAPDAAGGEEGGHRVVDGLLHVGEIGRRLVGAPESVGARAGDLVADGLDIARRQDAVGVENDQVIALALAGAHVAGVARSAVGDADVVDIKPVAVMVGHLVGGDGRAILDDNHFEASRRLPGKALQQLLHLVRAVEDGDDQGD